jgi:hypothetical protein
MKLLYFPMYFAQSIAQSFLGNSGHQRSDGYTYKPREKPSFISKKILMHDYSLHELPLFFNSLIQLPLLF